MRQTAGLDLGGVSIRIPLPGTPRRWVHPARDINLTFPPGQITAIVGESGCGKSVLALAALGLLPVGTQTRGSLHAAGLDVLAATEEQLRGIRGRGIGLIPQSAATQLTPVRTIGSTVAETLAAHGLPATTAAVTELLAGVDLPAEVAGRYPHEISGGMAQRVLVALTCALEPQVLLADEPTSALDAHSADIVAALLRARAADGAAVVLITHDLLAARATADRVAVMYAGAIVEHGPATVVLDEPAHDYTAALLAALPENGLRPPPGIPSSLVDPEPGRCPWHSRTGLDCAAAPLALVGAGHFAACGVQA